MKQIETNFLIYDLASKVNNKSKVSCFRFVFLTFTVSAISVFLYLLNSNLRENLDQLLMQPSMNVFYLQLITFITTSILGCYLSYKQSIPGQTESVAYVIINSVFYLFWLVLFSVMGLLALNDYDIHNIIKCDWVCIQRSLIGLLVPLAALTYFMKKGYIVNSYKAIITTSLTAFGFSSFLNLFICSETSPLFIFCSHNLVIIPVVLVFLLVAKLFK